MLLAQKRILNRSLPLRTGSRGMRAGRPGVSWEKTRMMVGSDLKHDEHVLPRPMEANNDRWPTSFANFDHADARISMPGPTIPKRRKQAR